MYYAYDPSKDEGYVYLPGPADESYRLNLSTIYRRVEGNWFKASRAWEIVARALIAKGKGN